MKVWEPKVLYLFSRAEKHGIPLEPLFAHLAPMSLERYIRRLLAESKTHSVFVWDWQSDGIRMRRVRLEGHRLSWSEPRHWIKKGNASDPD